MSDFDESSDSYDEADPALPLRGLRKRRPMWEGILNEDLPGLDEVKDFLEADDSSELADEELCTGCPLPSTPDDPTLFDREVAEVLKIGRHDLEAIVNRKFREPAADIMRKVWSTSWSVCNFKHLPHWLQDNDYLHDGHRPPLNSFKMCFKSIFRIHTETGNIWTHLLGFVAFLSDLIVLVTRPSEELLLSDKLAIGIFYLAAITCLGCSFLFHTVSCHSEFVGKIFSKLDYCGIAVLITGSFVPWLHYSFYCQIVPRIIYLFVVIMLGISSIVVSLWDKFSESRFRHLRAGVFTVYGLSGVVPAIHHAVAEGWLNALRNASLGWLILMGLLYILGAFLYAFRVPECFYPGKFDIWFQSHQIFHVLVIAAAFVHQHGISEMLTYRMSIGACAVQSATLVL